MTTFRFLLLIIALAAIDVAATIALKEAAGRRDGLLAIVGVGLFVLLAAVLYVALDATELTMVSLGWIVAVQVAVMVVDWRWYEFRPTPLQLAAICVAMAALVVAALAPAPSPGSSSKTDKPKAGRHAVPAQRESGQLEHKLRARLAEQKQESP